MQTIASPNKHKGRVAPIRVIVLHTMETGEDGNVAENVANYFAKRSTEASAHLCVDNNSTVRCVADTDTAWAAPGANADGLQIELAGRAGQSSSQWADAYSRDLLNLAAKQVAGWCTKYNIPAKRLTRAELRAGHKGITTHDDVSQVYKKSNHWDPGPNFPWEEFLRLVRGHLGAKPVKNDDTRPIAKPKPNTGPRWPGRMLHYKHGQALMTGHDVETFQRRLKELRYTIAVDGRYGPMTAATVKVLQRALGVVVDGVVGPKTWAAAW